MNQSVKQLLEAAAAVVPRISPIEARRMIEDGRAVVVDVRDAGELHATGKIASAINISRGTLEFRADPESPYYDGVLPLDKAIILYCAVGGRSALAGKTLKELGYREVYNLGGLDDWVASGGAVEVVAPSTER